MTPPSAAVVTLFSVCQCAPGRLRCLLAPRSTHFLLSNTFPSRTYGLPSMTPSLLPSPIPLSPESPCSFLTFQPQMLPSKAQADVIRGQPDVPAAEPVRVLLLCPWLHCLYARPWPGKSGSAGWSAAPWAPWASFSFSPPKSELGMLCVSLIHLGCFKLKAFSYSRQM